MKMNQIALIMFVVGSLSGNFLQDLDFKTGFCHNIDIRELTISKAHQLYENKQLTPYKLTQCYLKRIKKMNPYLNAVIETSFFALREAKRLRKKKELLGETPLFGIPILIVDSIGTTDGMETTSGSKALLGIKPREEATIVTALRQAGAIVLGKTNLSELSGAPEGWSTRGNQTINPYVLSESPKGSSSGSAVAVATNLCIIALGTEADGAIHLPSMTNSAVGFKPTAHSVSLRGIIALAPSQEAVGVIGRSIQDSQLVFKVLQRTAYIQNETNFYVKEKKNYRVGVIDFKSSDLTDEKHANFKKLLKKLNSTNISLVDGLDFHCSKIDISEELTIFAHEFKYYFNRYLKNEVSFTKKRNIKNFSDLLKFYENIQHYSDLYLLNETNLTKGLNSEEYQRAILIQSQARHEILNYMKKYRLDAIAAPGYDRNSIRLPALAGFPSISIPIGLDNEHPFSLLLYAPSWYDNILFDLSNTIESSGSFARHTPKFIS